MSHRRHSPWLVIPRLSIKRVGIGHIAHIAWRGWAKLVLADQPLLQVPNERLIRRVPLRARFAPHERAEV